MWQSLEWKTAGHAEVSKTAVPLMASRGCLQKVDRLFPLSSTEWLMGNDVVHKLIHPRVIVIDSVCNYLMLTSQNRIWLFFPQRRIKPRSCISIKDVWCTWLRLPSVHAGLILATAILSFIGSLTLAAHSLWPQGWFRLSALCSLIYCRIKLTQRCFCLYCYSLFKSLSEFCFIDS